MLDRLLTELPNPASTEIDATDTVAALRIMSDEDLRVAAAVKDQIPQIALLVDAAVAAFENGGRLFYIGAGTSGRLGVLDASECPPTFSVPPEMVQGIIAGGLPALARAAEISEDDPTAGEDDLLSRGFEAKDVLVGIATSGRTPYVLGAVRAAKRIGAVTAGISCTPDSELAELVDIPITPLVGPEVVAGSTRLKAGTATKLVLNMISTVSMIRMGYVYSNLMVNVQPTNEKLASRARRIIQFAAGVTGERAAELLEASGRNVRVAIVMGKLNLDREEAANRLERASGRIRAALDRV